MHDIAHAGTCEHGGVSSKWESATRRIKQMPDTTEVAAAGFAEK